MHLLFVFIMHFIQSRYVPCAFVQKIDASIMANKLILYMHPFSSPSRAVLLTGAALGIKFECRVINLFEAEHKKPEYIKVLNLFNDNCNFLYHLIAS